MLLLAAIAIAETGAEAGTGTSAESFASDAGDWVGGTVANGVLSLMDSAASLTPGDLSNCTVTARVRLVSGTALQFSAGAAQFAANYSAGGGLSLGTETAPFPITELSLSADAGAILVSTANEAEISDPELVEHGGVYILYYAAKDEAGTTNIYAATSTDLATFTRMDTPILANATDPAAFSDGTTLTLAFSRDGQLRFATSTDGRVATESSAVLSAGSGFDAAGLESPALVAADGVNRLWYTAIGTGQAGYATSTDGQTYTRESSLTTDSSRLSGMDAILGEYGWEAIYTMSDSLGFAVGGTDPMFADAAGDVRPIARTSDASWANQGFGTPSAIRVGQQLYVFVGASDEGDAVIGRFVAVPEPGGWATLVFDWDGTNATASWNGGPTLTTALDSIDVLTFGATGTVEIDEVTVSYSSTSDTGSVVDTGTDGVDSADTASALDTAGTIDSAWDTGSGMNAGEWLGDPGGCGCAQSPGTTPLLVSISGWAALLARMRRANSRGTSSTS